VGTLLVFASLVLLALILRAAWTRGRARQAIRDAGLIEGQLVAVDAIQDRAKLTGMRQSVLYSERYGVAGKPDRIIQTSRGPVPVDVKKCNCPRDGRPHDGHVAQVAVYCLLLEERYQCRVQKGIIDYIGRSVTVAFDDQLRTWILNVIQEVRAAKRSEVVATRSHNHRGKCGACGFRNDCREAIR
jgi:CRISPR-associated exonuclease Cas4